MKKTNKYIVLSLATCITLSPLVVRANNNPEGKEIIPISAPVDVMDEVKMPDYIKYEGKIVEVNNKEKHMSILVKDDENEPYNGMLFHLNEDVILLNDKTKDFINKESLKKGMSVTAYYYKDTVMAMSMPPQLSPDVIVVRESEEPTSILVSGFNKELISSDGGWNISPSEYTIIVDKNGNIVKKENIGDKDLIVFYTIVRESYPAQTTPEKIIVMKKEEEVKVESEVNVFDRIIIDDEEIILNKPLYKNDRGIMMVPLRQISETLGYEVKWNNQTKTAELVKGPQWTAVTIGKDNYNFAKMLIRLGTAPEIKDSTTYVPLSFLQEVLRVGVEVTEKGMIEIGQ